jgi:tetratricopeptide (TPR) repeat protein
VAQGKLNEALAAYRDSHAIDEALVAKDSSNTERQRDLSISDIKIGDVLVAQGKLNEALAAYRDNVGIAERLAAAERSNTQWQSELQYSVGKVGGLAYWFVLAHDFARGLEAADQAISLAPNKLWVHGNRAHALMFLGRLDEARAIYLHYRGAKKVQGEKSWETVVLEDFAELRKAGLTHPLMDEIEIKFTARG